MIVSLYLGLVELFLDALPVVELPSLDLLEQFLDTAIGYFINGVSVLTALVGKDTMGILKIYLLVVIVLNSFYLAYQVIWWFIKKIPLLNIDQ